MKKLIDISDYAALFGLLSLIPLHDGSLVVPLWVSLSLIGICAAGRFALLFRNRFFN